jgi:hypothetical protein
VTLFGELPPNRTQTMTLTHSGASELSQLMEGTTAGALIPEIEQRPIEWCNSGARQSASSTPSLTVRLLYLCAVAMGGSAREAVHRPNYQDHLLL